MGKISDFQMYCILSLLVGPVAVLETPRVMAHQLQNNSWIGVLAAFIPGILIIAMFSYIIKKSQSPFPLILEEHLGKYLGKALGFVYIFFFLLVASFTVRWFVDFIETNVLPQTPISIFIGVLLFLGFYSLRTGMQSFVRVAEIIIIVDLAFTLIIAFMGIGEFPRFENLLPLTTIHMKPFGLGLFSASYILGKMQPVLTFSSYSLNRERIFKIMLWVVATYVVLITLTTLATILSLGSLSGTVLVFSTFSMVRLLRIGTFIQNIDIVFIGIWIMAIFGATTLPWFMSCYCTQQMFHLKDYRFLAAPTAIIIGIFSIVLSKNILELIIMETDIIPLLYSLFFLGIPFILFLICLFKRAPEQTQTTVPQDEPA
ncbi:MAG TPA: endospore germination permease [Syntrophomonadaceae bacterium]|nr:endospore germination permease [Syntrophomonadaceae bacterium]